MSSQPSIFSPEGFVAACPSFLQPYLKLSRAHKPIGTWLFYIPALWSMTMASPPGHFPDAYTLAMFGFISILIRGAGCAINDMWDRDFDRNVERTKTRPLASGEISMFQAFCWLLIQGGVAIWLLYSFNDTAGFLGVIHVPLYIGYPLAKRFTGYPQFALGVAFNWSVLLGWAVVNKDIDWNVVGPLFGSCMAWTIAYDTIYGHQDKSDDIKIGVKSTSITFGEQTKFYVSFFSLIAVVGLAYTGHISEQTWPFFAGLALYAAHLAYQVIAVDIDNPEDCGAKFFSNKDIGLATWVFFLVALMTKSPK